MTLKNNIFLWVKLIFGFGYIAIEGLDNHFYSADSIGCYKTKEIARWAWLKIAKKYDLKKYIDWDYE